MKSKTKEEIEAEIEIHKRTGAHRKVALLEERLSAVCGSVQSVGESETAKIDTEVVAGEEAAYYLKINTDLSWKEITEKTGVKTPWLKVKKFAKDNDLPYNA